MMQTRFAATTAQKCENVSRLDRPCVYRHPDASTLRENDEPNAEVPAEIASYLTLKMAHPKNWIDRDALLETAPEEELDEETLRRAIKIGSRFRRKKLWPTTNLWQKGCNLRTRLNKRC